LARTLTNPCLGHEPKVTVVTVTLNNLIFGEIATTVAMKEI